MLTFDLRGNSTFSRSMRSDVKPEPVPPPNAWNTMKPWKVDDSLFTFDNENR